MVETRYSGLTRSEWIALASIVISISISAGAALINKGAQNAQITSLQTTVVNLNTSVTTLNQTLQTTREEVSALKAQRESTDKALSDIKSSLETYIRDARYR